MNTPSNQCILWLQMKKRVDQSHFSKSTFLSWAFCLWAARAGFGSDLTPAAAGDSPCTSRVLGSARKQITRKNLVATSENLSLRD